MSWMGLEGGVIELKFKDLVLCWSWEVSEYCYLFFFQFNYMHECFERVFCELKWRKEVIVKNS